MAALSNPQFSRAGEPAMECRPVRRPEIESALRILLATAKGPAPDSQVLDFLSFSIERGIDTNSLWIAIHQDRTVWAMLPVQNPGKTMLIFTPMHLLNHTPHDAVSQLSEAVSEHFAARGVQLAQMLIDPTSRPVIDLYRQTGFEELAELLYLQKAVRKRTEFPAIPAEFELLNYSLQTHPKFAEIISRSYEQSLDCPALNGMRDMNDVILGHQATGEFDSDLWWVLMERGQPIAVLLMARLTHGSSLELVYLGVALESRGRGIGDMLMKLAFAKTAAEGKENLSLAVDSKNQPALGLYFRHGMRRIGSRVAMLRDLRNAAQYANV
jgi:mycothiol synthase